MVTFISDISFVYKMGPKKLLTDYNFIRYKITEIIKITDIISIGVKSYEYIMHVFKNKAGAFYHRCMK